MPDAFLETSVVIGLHFRHAGEKAACRAAIPAGAACVSSRYVEFEIARGFLRSLIALHNLSFEFTSFADLHLAAHSGQRRFKPYQMHTWLGAFDDYEAALETEDSALLASQKLEAFRAKLRGWIRRGWTRMQRDFASVIDDIKCRDPLPPPVHRSDDRLDQTLKLDRCGIVTACGLQTFVHRCRPEVARLADELEQLPATSRDRETLKRIEALRGFLKSGLDSNFEGRKCHACGDAFIVIEAPADHVIVTKNGKHLEPIARILGKSLSNAVTSKSTQASESEA